MPDLSPQPIIAEAKVTKHILRAFGLRASKRLGQNFLIDPTVAQDIVAAGEVKSGDSVLEIGPGIGALTQTIAMTGANVTAVELDKKLPEVLAQTLAPYPNVKIVPGDILKTDIISVMEKRPFKVIASLPYYVTTPILMFLLENRLPMTHIVTMVQAEVAERIIAPPGGKDYGSLSVAVQYFTEPVIVRRVAAKSFYPAPEVESAVIACRVREKMPVNVVSEDMFFRVVKAAFGQRRKTFVNALKGAGFDKSRLQSVMQSCSIDENRRGETMSLAEFAAVANGLEKERNVHSGRI